MSLLGGREGELWVIYCVSEIKRGKKGQALKKKQQMVLNIWDETETGELVTSQISGIKSQRGY